MERSPMKLTWSMELDDMASALADAKKYPKAHRICEELLECETAAGLGHPTVQGRTLLALDTLGFSPTEIEKLAEMCGHDGRKIAGLLVAEELGIILRGTLKHAATNGGVLEIETVLTKLQERMPSFRRDSKEGSDAVPPDSL
ncbi:MAG: hypothetical protein A2666_04280 [Parcubacteria group bacterium RIFCSPHIGHO2_01_FULL_47_10b]|nr:MAG: hypothetical protein A2666_04280 [Parcubacteria group bacterium RIFCSPHIGHO2_01_FULL_47_10b]